MLGFNKTPDGANKLAEKLQTCKVPDDFHALRTAMEARRNYIRTRRSEIGGEGMFAGPEREKAIKKGLEAEQALNKEIEDLNFEYSYLDRIEQLAVAGCNEVEIAELRKAIPAAIKRMPAEIAAVRKAMEAFDAAIAKLTESQHSIAGYQNAGVAFPLNQLEVQSLLQLREAVWKPRSLPVILPEVPSDTDPKGQHEYFKTYPEAYRVKGLVHSLRQPPAYQQAFASDL